jgi:Ca-activated chloride channel family protein
MRFALPLLWLLAVPVLIAVAAGWRWSRQRSSGVPLAGLSLVTGDLPATWRSRVRRALPALRLAALVVLVAALARPQTVATSERVTSEGIDIVLALDISGSMLAEDFQPDNRLAVAKRVMGDFIRGRKADRIGLVVFAGASYTQCPLTLDYPVIEALLEQVRFGLIDDGTAIGMAIANGVNRLTDSKAKSRILVLLTDGENNAGPIDPKTAAELAKARGIRIYTIGVGREGVARIPVADPMFGQRYRQVETHIDEESLQEIAQVTGGRYFRADDPKALAGIFSTIDSLEKTEVEVKHYHRYGELFPWVAGAGLVLLLGETLLRAGPLAGVP